MGKLSVLEANPNEPYRVFAYGPEGVGKSTFGAMAEKPLFLAAERGFSRLRDRDGKPVKYLPADTYLELRSNIRKIRSEEHDFKTLIVDTADWVEKAVHAEVGGGKDIIRAAGGYGAGFRESERIHREVISDLEDIRLNRGMNLIVLGHAHVKEAKDPQMESYDEFIIKGHELTTSLWREWAEAVFFIRFKTYLKQGDEMKKTMAFGSEERVVFTTKRPAFQAKNRYGMPHEMVFDLNFYDKFYEYVKSGLKEESLDNIIAEIGEMKLKLDEGTQKAIDDTVMKVKTIQDAKAIRERVKLLTGGSSGI